jgi:hypothetical protein
LAVTAATGGQDPNPIARLDLKLARTLQSLLVAKPIDPPVFTQQTS